MTFAEADAACHQVTGVGLLPLEGSRDLWCDALPTAGHLFSVGLAILKMCNGRVCSIFVGAKKSENPDWQSKTIRLVRKISKKYGPPTCSRPGELVWLWELDTAGRLHPLQEGVVSVIFGHRNGVFLSYATRLMGDEFRRERQDAY
jgi:hypothetical protein